MDAGEGEMVRAGERRQGRPTASNDEGRGDGSQTDNGGKEDGEMPGGVGAITMRAPAGRVVGMNRGRLASVAHVVGLPHHLCMHSYLGV